MAWISFVCLLALSSAAFVRSASYGSYSAPSVMRDLPVESSYGTPSIPKMRDLPVESSYGTPSIPKMRDLPVESSYGTPLISKMRDLPVESSYGTPSIPKMRDLPVESSYGTPSISKDFTEVVRDIPVSSGYGSYSAPRKMIVQSDFKPRIFPTQHQLMLEQQAALQQKIAESVVPTEFDILCRGQRPETVIPLDGGRRYVTCLDDGKGHEQWCPQGLLFHPEQRRCERKLGLLESPCASNPCLNNGQCIQTDTHSFKCECPTGFDGRLCELDATVCHTQLPCGSSFDSRCQSFRWGAALSHMCVFESGRAYGLTAGQVFPSPCKGIDGTFPLAFSDKGFIMCDGERMHIETCPGGTVWNDFHKACIWAGTEETTFADERPKTLSYDSYSTVQRPMPVIETPKFRDLPVKQSYGYAEEQPRVIPTFRDLPIKSSYGTSLTEKSIVLADEPKVEYGAKVETVLPQQDRIVEPVNSYGASRMLKSSFIKPAVRQFDIRPTSGY